MVRLYIIHRWGFCTNPWLLLLKRFNSQFIAPASHWNYVLRDKESARREAIPYLRGVCLFFPHWNNFQLVPQREKKEEMEKIFLLVKGSFFLFSSQPCQTEETAGLQTTTPTPRLRTLTPPPPPENSFLSSSWIQVMLQKQRNTHKRHC